LEFEPSENKRKSSSFIRASQGDMRRKPGKRRVPSSGSQIFEGGEEYEIEERTGEELTGSDFSSKENANLGNKRMRTSFQGSRLTISKRRRRMILAGKKENVRALQFKEDPCSSLERRPEKEKKDEVPTKWGELLRDKPGKMCHKGTPHNIFGISTPRQFSSRHAEGGECFSAVRSPFAKGPWRGQSVKGLF